MNADPLWFENLNVLSINYYSSFRCHHKLLFSFHRKHQMHPLFVELHIHRKKQTENNSFNILKDQKCELQFLYKLVTSYLIVVLEKFSNRSEGHVARSIVGISVYTRGDTGEGLRSFNTHWCWYDVSVSLLFLTDRISIRICDWDSQWI